MFSLPPYGGIREDILPSGCRTFIDRLLSYIRFVKETRLKNLRGNTRKIFRALDNDDKL